MLLENDAEVEIVNKEGLTPLMIASASGHDEIVTELLKRGASMTTTTKDGETALSWAQKNEHDGVVEILEKWSVKRKKKQAFGGDTTEL